MNVFSRSLCTRSLVLRVAVQRDKTFKRQDIEGGGIRLDAGNIIQEEMNAVLMGPQFIPLRVSCHPMNQPDHEPCLLGSPNTGLHM